MAERLRPRARALLNQPKTRQNRVRNSALETPRRKTAPSRRLTGRQSGHSLLESNFRPRLGVCGEIDDMPLSRQQLIEALGRVAQGDRAAFEAVYAATSLKLYGIVVR